MKPKSWPDYFEMIEKRPALFFGKASLLGLQFEIQGILVAEDIHAIPQEKRLGGFSFEKFEKWVDERYNTRHLMIKSFTLARYLASKNREVFFEQDYEEDTVEAFEMWFMWYHKYQSEQIV